MVQVNRAINPELLQGGMPQGLEPASYPTPIVNDSRKEFFVHIHMPKTGGTTFNSILKKNFAKEPLPGIENALGFEQFAGRFTHLFGKFTNEQMMTYIKRHTVIDCVASHNFSAILPYQTSPRKIVAIAFVREPVDRFFSLYFHLRHVGGEFVQAQMNIEEYVEEKTADKSPQHRLQGYLHHFAGEDSDAAYSYIESLVQNGHLYLFDTYRMTDALNILQRHFPEQFENVSYEVENVSYKDQQVTDDMRIKVRRVASENDYRLLELANNLMDRA